MTISTFSTLKSAVADWLDRDDLDMAIDTMIGMVEAEVYRSLRVPEMESALSVALSGGVAAKPADFLEAKYTYMDSNPVNPIEWKSSDWIIRNYPTRSSTGLPSFAAISGSDIIFGPYPDGDYTLSGVYYAKPTALSLSNETNFLVEDHPDLLLYGALAHSAGYVGQDERSQYWGAQFQSALTQIQAQGGAQKFPSDIPLRAVPG